jgi:hypothetical protein
MDQGFEDGNGEQVRPEDHGFSKDVSGMPNYDPLVPGTVEPETEDSQLSRSPRSDEPEFEGILAAIGRRARPDSAVVEPIFDAPEQPIDRFRNFLSKRLDKALRNLGRHGLRDITRIDSHLDENVSPDDPDK